MTYPDLADYLYTQHPDLMLDMTNLRRPEIAATIAGKALLGIAGIVPMRLEAAGAFLRPPLSISGLANYPVFVPVCRYYLARGPRSDV